jgi:hypothetical protein
MPRRRVGRPALCTIAKRRALLHNAGREHKKRAAEAASIGREAVAAGLLDAFAPARRTSSPSRTAGRARS